MQFPDVNRDITDTAYPAIRLVGALFIHSPALYAFGPFSCSSATSPLILAVASRLGMSVACLTRQLGAIGNFSQLLESLACAVGIIPHVLRVFRQDAGCFA
jgi:hypothetical protein